MKKRSSITGSALDVILIALLAGVSMGAGQAAERIRYQEIFQRVPGSNQILEHNSFTIVTLDGTKHRARRLQLLTDHVELFHGNVWEERLPSEQIARIEIRQSGRYFHYVEAGAVFPVGLATFLCGAPTNWPCHIIVTTLLSPAWAYTAVTAPFFLAADAIGFFLPAKIYEIVH
jgi:hypothetical protein